MSINKSTLDPDEKILQLLCKRFVVLAHQYLV
jgi:hypothetical protein